MVLKHHDAQGPPAADLPLVEWCCRELLYQAQEQLHGVLRNFPVRSMAALMRLFIFPRGRTYFAPSDRLGRQVAALMQEPGNRATGWPAESTASCTAAIRWAPCSRRWN